ncbi:unnamed protein product [Orchesella dallaii]|uniref:Thioredoxin domain-containing protein n=1 Tax=Orchesella dallaii TaxID=48710 RepID=A0ABP1PK24_9HEXA
MHENVGIKEGPIHGAQVAQPSDPVWGLHTLHDEIFLPAIYNVTRAFISFCTSWSSKCQAMNIVWRELANEARFVEDFIVGAVDCTDSKNTCRKYGVVGYPSFLWFHKGHAVDKYSSADKSFETLKQWMLKRLGIDKLAATSLYKKPEPIGISKEDFFRALDEKKMLFVQFGTPWCSRCVELSETWKDLAAYFSDQNLDEKSKIIISIFDCRKNQLSCEELKVRDFPTFNLYKDGRLYMTYTGDDDLHSLIAYVQTFIDRERKDEL